MTKKKKTGSERNRQGGTRAEIEQANEKYRLAMQSGKLAEALDALHELALAEGFYPPHVAKRYRLMAAAKAKAKAKGESFGEAAFEREQDAKERAEMLREVERLEKQVLGESAAPANNDSPPVESVPARLTRLLSVARGNRLQEQPMKESK